MSVLTSKTEKRNRRRNRIRARVIGTDARPRLAVFRSNKFVYAQLINDEAGKTLAAASTKELKAKTPLEKASELGKEIAKKAATLKITSIVFDRGGYLYTGKIKAVAEGARSGGLQF